MSAPPPPPRPPRDALAVGHLALRATALADRARRNPAYLEAADAAFAEVAPDVPWAGRARLEMWDEAGRGDRAAALAAELDAADDPAAALWSARRSTGDAQLRWLRRAQDLGAPGFDDLVLAMAEEGSLSDGTTGEGTAMLETALAARLMADREAPDARSAEAVWGALDAVEAHAACSGAVSGFARRVRTEAMEEYAEARGRGADAGWRRSTVTALAKWWTTMAGVDYDSLVNARSKELTGRMADEHDLAALGAHLERLLQPSAADVERLLDPAAAVAFMAALAVSAPPSLSDQLHHSFWHGLVHVPSMGGRPATGVLDHVWFDVVSADASASAMFGSFAGPFAVTLGSRVVACQDEWFEEARRGGEIDFLEVPNVALIESFARWASTDGRALCESIDAPMEADARILGAALDAISSPFASEFRANVERAEREAAAARHLEGVIASERGLERLVETWRADPTALADFASSASPQLVEHLLRSAVQRGLGAPQFVELGEVALRVDPERDWLARYVASSLPDDEVVGRFVSIAAELEGAQRAELLSDAADALVHQERDEAADGLYALAAARSAEAATEWLGRRQHEYPPLDGGGILDVVGGDPFREVEGRRSALELRVEEQLDDHTPEWGSDLDVAPTEAERTEAVDVEDLPGSWDL